MTKESDALAAFLSACIDGGMSGGEMKIAMAKFTRLAQPQGEPAIGCKCPLCGEWQRSTRSGMVCKNGHGGATGLNRRLFTHPAHTEQEVQEILDASYRESGALVVVVRRILGVPAP
jgi:hypothetical protein